MNSDDLQDCFSATIAPRPRARTNAIACVFPFREVSHLRAARVLIFPPSAQMLLCQHGSYQRRNGISNQIPTPREPLVKLLELDDHIGIAKVRSRRDSVDRGLHSSFEAAERGYASR